MQLTNTGLNVLYIFFKWHIVHSIVIQIHLNSNTKAADNIILLVSVITREQPVCSNKNGMNYFLIGSVGVVIERRLCV